MKLLKFVFVLFVTVSFTSCSDSETDANAAKAADIPIILLEDGYTEKNTTEIHHNHLVRDFVNIEKIVKEYL